MPINDDPGTYFDDLNVAEWRAAIVACLEDERRRKELSVALLLEFGLEGFALLDDVLSSVSAVEGPGQDDGREPNIACVESFPEPSSAPPAFRARSR